MEFDSLNFFLDHLASTGTCFSLEHRMAIQASLTKLCNDNHFEDVHFWGKILGTDKDYYIAYGIGKDYLKDRTYFYSMNHGLQWIFLPPPSTITIELALASTGRFIGDPTADTDTEIVPDDADVVDEGEQWVKIKEEDRLSATVAAITAEAAIIPRGSLVKSPVGLIYKNKAFDGLTRADAMQLVSYFHCRRPKSLYDQHVVRRSDYNLTLDFLESIANDVPIGCWTMAVDSGETTALVRSWLWPGAYGVSTLKNSRRSQIFGGSLHGWWYIGTGKKNWDLPFMISQPPRDASASVVVETEGEDGGGDTADKMKTNLVSFR